MSAENNLRTQANLDAPDEVYQQLVDAHRDLDASRSALLNARLILLLANHIGDTAVLKQAIAAAREGLEDAAMGSEHPSAEVSRERPQP
jgi:hypothetical protein